jgi:hypothetical protein
LKTRATNTELYMHSLFNSAYIVFCGSGSRLDHGLFATLVRDAMKKREYEMQTLLEQQQKAEKEKAEKDKSLITRFLG